jgi:aspartyl-tRNA(Asn)/glutamyl-tRNA(Gln) amidotransferase subunit C
MPLSHEEVEHIAVLARLELSQAQKAGYQVQLSAILDYIAKLQELDTQGIPPTAGGGSILEMPLRPDEARPGLTPEQLLANAAQVEGGQFKIPPVFE